ICNLHGLSPFVIGIVVFLDLAPNRRHRRDQLIPSRPAEPADRQSEPAPASLQSAISALPCSPIWRDFRRPVLSGTESQTTRNSAVMRITSMWAALVANSLCRG